MSAGKLNRQALFYVACGRERVEDIVTSIDLDYERPRRTALPPPGSNCRIRCGTKTGKAPQCAR